VAYADLDLADPADARKMLQRIREAAAATCRDARKASGGPAAETFEYCRAHVERDAVRRLKAPAVRQAYMTPADSAPLLADAR
jgi:UrcA family protein